MLGTPVLRRLKREELQLEVSLGRGERREKRERGSPMQATSCLMCIWTS